MEDQNKALVEVLTAPQNEETVQQMEKIPSQIQADALIKELRAMVKYQKKQLIYSRIGMLITVLIISAAILVGFTVTKRVREVASQVSALQVRVESINLDALDFNKVNDVIASLTEASDTLSQFDMNSFNEGILSFGEAVDQFRELDIDNLNGLVDSLKTVAEALENTTNAFKKIFGK